MSQKKKKKNFDKTLALCNYTHFCFMYGLIKILFIMLSSYEKKKMTKTIYFMQNLLKSHESINT